MVFAIRISQSFKRLPRLQSPWEKEMNMCAKRNSPRIHHADSQMPFDLMSDGGAEEAESGG